jgi:hypothetical protein
MLPEKDFADNPKTARAKARPVRPCSHNKPPSPASLKSHLSLSPYVPLPISSFAYFNNPRLTFSLSAVSAVNPLSLYPF